MNLDIVLTTILAVGEMVYTNKKLLLMIGLAFISTLALFVTLKCLKHHFDVMLAISSFVSFFAAAGAFAMAFFITPDEIGIVRVSEASLPTTLTLVVLMAIVIFTMPFVITTTPFFFAAAVLRMRHRFLKRRESLRYEPRPKKPQRIRREKEVYQWK